METLYELQRRELSERERKELWKLCRIAIVATKRIRSRREWRIMGEDLVDNCLARTWRECERQGFKIHTLYTMAAWDQLFAIIADCAIAAAHNPTLFPDHLFSQSEIAQALRVSKRSVQRWNLKL